MAERGAERDDGRLPSPYLFQKGATDVSPSILEKLRAAEVYFEKHSDAPPSWMLTEAIVALEALAEEMRRFWPKEEPPEMKECPKPLRVLGRQLTDVTQAWADRIGTSSGKEGT